jgi:hypothetical protein
MHFSRCFQLSPNLATLPANNFQVFSTMFKRKLTQADILLIPVNLLPVIGVWFWSWSPEAVFIVYCFETIIIGFFTLLKIAIAGITRGGSDTWYNQGSRSQMPFLFFMLFFLVHYGLFVTIQMGIFFSVSGIGAEHHITLRNFFSKWPELLDENTMLMLAAFIVSYGYRMLQEFILTGSYKTAPLMLLMFQPYLRIFVQQFTVIAGSIFLGFGAGKVFILIFAVVKIIAEVYLNFDRVLDKAMVDMKDTNNTT